MCALTLNCTVSGSLGGPLAIADWPEAWTTALNYSEFSFKYSRLVLIRNMAVFIASEYPAESKILSVLRKLHDSILTLPPQQDMLSCESLKLSRDDKGVVRQTLDLVRRDPSE
jgi:hypothetical protein